ncbi:MAG: nitroreductase family protein [Deltaproteobacteria bacterium]|nr:nitroreductase family protein [Deltaproteobacteria bacterium]
MEKPALTATPIHELLATRWSPCSFLSQRLDEEAVTALLEAARWAASAYNEQPWRLLIATNDDPTNHAKMASIAMEGNRIWAERAPLLILTVTKDRYSHNDAPNPYGWHDLGMATAQLTAEATARGLAVHQMAGFFADAARRVYAIPEGFTPVSLLAVGYPGEPDALPEPLRRRDHAPRRRKDLGEIAFSGTWGAAAR